jgi:AmpD protein
VDLVVVHAISLPPGVFGSGHVVEFFMGRLDPKLHPAYEELQAVRVSAHFFLEREGMVHQFVDTDDTAWHAGESLFRGHSRCNDFSVGIELEGDGRASFTAKQYEVLGILCGSLMIRYPGILPDRVVGHCDVAPGRKWDPGPRFDWRRVRETLQEVWRGDP